MIIPSRSRAFAVALAAVAAAGGSFAAVHVHLLGLTLSHYDARGHLIVARRIADSLTPGWQQIGAVWLPLPHLLNAVPVQFDLLYRTGASGVAISVVSFAVAVGALAWMLVLMTGSRWAATAGVAAFALNPNVLYLQATPMTEPLFIGLIALGVALLARWCARVDVVSPGDGNDRNERTDCRPMTIGLVLALACLTRYEAWPVTVAALVLAVSVERRAGRGWREGIRRILPMSMFPALAILGYAVFSRVVIGEWLVSSGFFVPENTALGHPLEALSQIGWGLRTLSGRLVLAVGVVGLIGLAVGALSNRARAWAAVPLSILAAAAVPWVAFVQGHPYRIRYMIPLIAAEAVGVGVAAGFAKRAAPAVAIALIAMTAIELRPLNLGAAMIQEAKWDQPNVAARQKVTSYLRSHYAGESVMVSLGSLGHYVQELGAAGFAMREFLHEGNGDVWLSAIARPRPFAGWILIEEKAEGGDVLARRAREDPHFLDGFARVCEGAGVALYRRAALSGPLHTAPTIRTSP